MPNGILNHHNNNCNTKTSNKIISDKHRHDDATSVASSDGQQNQQNQNASILNVAEMILHGVADIEILDIWLRSISCPEFVANFVNAGYDMPTISRITPQDLTAIGITDPTKRLKILSEIRKLNLQDGIPEFRPASLSHWLSLIRLDSYYYKSLCDQQIDTIDKLCQLTWEDFEELGITKLGHQKRLQLAIERMKEIEAEAKKSSKIISEPIYDSSPSQILLMASTENHSMNGPIINKQSSTSEISSTGSGSMHSVYSANSSHYQPTYAALPSMSEITNGQHQHQNINPSVPSMQAQQAIYCQPAQLLQAPQSSPLLPPMQHTQHQQSHYQTINYPPNGLPPPQLSNANNLNDNGLNNTGRNTMVPHNNRQSLGQLPFSALANLPKHQQQLLQQSSIYATLSRQPQRHKQPPPPVPVRTNSLKTNSLSEELDDMQPPRTNSNASSSSTMFRPNNRTTNRGQLSSQTMLHKNKSFSGNAYMDAARAKFLSRNSQHPFVKLPQPIQSISQTSNGVSSTNDHTNNQAQQQMCNGINYNGFSTHGDDQSGTQVRPPATSAGLSATSRLVGSNQFNSLSVAQQLQRQQGSQASQTPVHVAGNLPNHSDDFEVHSDTNSTKSLFLPSSGQVSSQMDANRQANNCSSQGSGSSQTLYNSASSGSNEQNYSQADVLMSHRSTASSSTLNDVNLTLDQQAQQFQHQQHRTNNLAATNNLFPTVGKTSLVQNNDMNCNATTGKDDDFPPPPSPLSLTDSDEHDILSLNSDSNFNDISQGLMTFRVGI